MVKGRQYVLRQIAKNAMPHEGARKAAVNDLQAVRASHLLLGLHYKPPFAQLRRLSIPSSFLLRRTKTTMDRGATWYIDCCSGKPCSEKSSGLVKLVSTILSQSWGAPSWIWNCSSCQNALIIT